MSNPKGPMLPKGPKPQSSLAGQELKQLRSETLSLHSTVYNEELMEDALAFGRCMTHDSVAVFHQAQTGLAMGIALKKLATDLHKLEDQYSTKLETILTGHKKRMAKTIDKDGMNIFSSVLEHFYQMLSERTAAHQQSTEDLMHNVISPLNTLEETAKRGMKELNSRVMAAQNVVLAATDQVRKSKKDCMVYIKALKDAVERQSGKEDTGRARQKTTFGSKVASLRFGSNVSDITEKACTLADQHRDAVQTANDTRERFVSKELPLYLNEYQQYELQRLQQLKLHLTSLNKVFCERDDKLSKISHASTTVLECMRPEDDIMTYVLSIIRDNGMPPPLEPYRYSLPCTSEELRNGLLDVDPSSNFHTTLSSLMERQATELPTDKLPKVLSVILDKLKALQFGVEGVFRLSVRKADLEALAGRLDKGEWDALDSVEDPHMVACLLKLWLRSLREPVIEPALYDQAINAVGGSRTRPGDPRLSSVDAADKVLLTIGELKAVNQEVIRQLVQLSNAVVSQTAVNRMSMEALSVVFAPCLFRTPDTRDPLHQLQLSKLEATFIKHLLLNFQR